MKGEAELVGDANTSLALHDSASPSTSSSPGGLRLELLLSLLLIGALLVALAVAWRTRKACQRKAALQRSAPVALGKLQSHAAWPNFAYLVGLGFPRAKVAQALRASSNDLPEGSGREQLIVMLIKHRLAASALRSGLTICLAKTILPFLSDQLRIGNNAINVMASQACYETRMHTVRPDR